MSESTGPKPEPKCRLLNVTQTARYLGISTTKLYMMLRDNTFPVKPKKIGKKKLFDVKELGEYVDSL